MSSPHAPFKAWLCFCDRGVLLNGKCFGNGGEKQGWEHGEGDGIPVGRDNVILTVSQMEGTEPHQELVF